MLEKALQADDVCAVRRLERIVALRLFHLGMVALVYPPAQGRTRVLIFERAVEAGRCGAVKVVAWLFTEDAMLTVPASGNWGPALLSPRRSYYFVGAPLHCAAVLARPRAHVTSAARPAFALTLGRKTAAAIRPCVCASNQPNSATRRS